MTARQAGVPGATDSKEVAHAKIRLSVALLKAACVEYNVEPRYPRLLAEACYQSGDRDGEIDALTRYRRIQLPEVQHDEFAQVRFIDLNTAALQDDAVKINYLQQLVGISAVSENVRSHIAFELSKLLADKFDKQGAQDMIAKAIELNPLNGDALQARYSQIQATGTPADRVAALVALLKCNPARPDYLGALADALASVGQMDAAAEWYKRGFDVATQIGERWDGGRYLDYAASLEITGQPRKAAEATAMVLNDNPANARAAILQLLIARQMVNAPIAGSQAADQQALTKAKQAALAAITAQLGSMHAPAQWRRTLPPALARQRPSRRTSSAWLLPIRPDSSRSKRCPPPIRRRANSSTRTKLRCPISSGITSISIHSRARPTLCFPTLPRSCPPTTSN